MKIIFESETELGRCDADRVNGHFGDDPGDWIAFAYTTAALTGPGGMLRIEQQCYLRSTLRPDEVRNQAWVKPSMSLEPSLSARHETVQMVEQLHQRFVQEARETFAEQSVLAVPSIAC